MARPSKLTPELQASIVEALTAGASRKSAAVYAGIDEGTLGRWMRRFAGFAGAIRQAEARCNVRAALTIRQAFESGDWRAALAYLERREPDEWGKTERIEIQVRRAAERIAAKTGADPDWLVRRAAEIVEAESGSTR